MRLKTLSVLSVSSSLHVLLSFLLCSFSILSPYVIDNASIEKFTPLVLSSVYLLGDILLGESGEKANDYPAVGHRSTWKVEAEVTTYRGDLNAWKDFNEKLRCHLGVMDKEGAKMRKSEAGRRYSMWKILWKEGMGRFRATVGLGGGQRRRVEGVEVPEEACSEHDRPWMSC